MEQASSRTSRVSGTISTTDSCPETDCPQGTKKNESSCAPCCITKSQQKTSSSRSRHLLTDNDFEKIKDQLREARKKLDEAVAMVSRTVSTSSSAFTADRITPENDASPISSYTKFKTSEKPPINLKNCPLGHTRSGLKSQTESSLCLDSCSKEQIPSCVSKETLRKRPEEQQSFLRRTVDLNPSTVTCSPILPCDLPSITSRQEISRPSSAKSGKSLPSSSTKIEESQRRIDFDRTSTRVSEDERHLRSREIYDKRNAEACGLNKAKSSEFSTLCSTLCLNMDPPPCTVEELLKKKAEELNESLRRMSTANSIELPCKRMFPCEIPSTSKQFENRPPATSTKSLPASSTRIQEIRQSQPSRTTDDSSYIRFSEGLERKRIDRMCKASQTDDDALCSKTCSNTQLPPCESKEVLKPKQSSPRKMVNRNPSMTVPCTPMFPCDVPSLILVPPVKPINDLPASHSRIEESQRRVIIERTNSNSPSKEDLRHKKLGADHGKKKETVHGVNEATSKEFNIVCTTISSNTDPPPCELEQSFRKETKKVRDSLNKASASVKSKSSTVPCKPIFPCELPPIPSHQDLNRPSSSARRSPTPTKTKEVRLKNSHDEQDYIKFRDSIDLLRNTYRASQVNVSDYDDPLGNPSTSKLEEASNKKMGIRQDSRRSSANSDSFTIPCVPMLPCDIPSVTSTNEASTSNVSFIKRPPCGPPSERIMGSSRSSGQCVKSKPSEPEKSSRGGFDHGSKFVDSSNQRSKTILKSGFEETDDAVTRTHGMQKNMSKTKSVVFMDKK